MSSKSIASARMKIGIISSAGGSAFGGAYRILEKIYPGKFEFFVVTDRLCGIEEFCDNNKISRIRIEEKDKAIFSKAAREYFQAHGKTEFVLLLFTRLVTEELFSYLPTINIHPALLPAYKGFNAVKQALNGGAKFFGTTAHLVDEEIDNGKIVAQAVAPINVGDDLERLNKISFLQKVYLFLLLVELFDKGGISVSDDCRDFVVDKSLVSSYKFNPIMMDERVLEEYENLYLDEINLLVKN